MKRRTRIAKGIYRDKYGLAATVKVRRIQRERRFPLDTPIETIIGWQLETRAELYTDAAVRTPVSGTLKADADRFIERRKATAAYKADRAHLRAWYATFGDRNRHTLTAADLTRQVSLWTAAGVAARTIRHRVRVLRELLTALDGKADCCQVSLPRIPPAHPVAVPVETITAVAAKLAKAGTPQDYARFLVRATTGQRPAQIMRATPADLDLKRKLWFVRSAKGGDPVPLPLNPEMVQAWTLFMQAEAWGPFDTTRAAQILRAHGWPAGVRPYALRHTFAIDLLRGGTDLGDVQGLLGHRQIQTTRQHYGPILISRLTAAVASRTLGLPAAYQPKSASRRAPLKAKHATKRHSRKRRK